MSIMKRAGARIAAASRTRLKGLLGSALVLVMIATPAGCERASTTTDTEAGSTVSTNPTVAAALSPEAERGAVVSGTIDPHSLTPTELQFGRSPKLDPSVTYQPGALIMEHGDSAIRSMESNGMIWHFDAGAPQVADIAVGKILFATERCAGRVLGVTQNGTDVAVLLGPVQITDLIAKAHIAYNQPLDLASAIVVPVPDFPVSISQPDPNASPTPAGTNASASPSAAGDATANPSAAAATDASATPGAAATTDASATPSAAPTSTPTGPPSAALPAATTTSALNDKLHLQSVTYAVVTTSGVWRPFRTVVYDATGRAHVRPVRALAQRVAQVQLPMSGVSSAMQTANTVVTGLNAPLPSIGDAAAVSLQGTLSPCLSSCGGMGLQVRYDKNGLTAVAKLVFFLNKPSLHVNLDINNGINTVGITLGGTGGIKATVDMAADKSYSNVHITGGLPIDVSFPISVVPPLSVHLSQTLAFATAFSAKTSTFHAEIQFRACCQVSAGYYNGKLDADGPDQVGLVGPKADASGLSVGINSAVFAVNQKVLVGVGLAGFAAGPYVSFTSSLTGLKQSSVVMRDCSQVTLGLTLAAGIGWSIPAVVVKIVNGFFSFISAVFHTQVPPLQASGSIVKMDPRPLVDYRGEVPNGCSG
jgi:hypothetical protein